MKKKLLSLTIPILLFSGFSNASIEVWNQEGNKVSLNGHLKAAKRMSKDHNIRGDNSEARLGISAETQIFQDLTGVQPFDY